MALFADEPLALKGGIACVLQKKNKQHILTAHKFRSIMLRNYVIKHHHAFLRTRLYALVHCSFHAAQSGGIKGRGTDLANATVRWNQHAYKGHNQSCVIFFTDVEAAFYSTIRELLLPQAQSPDSIEDILDKTGVPLIFVEPLEKLLAEPPLLEQLLGDHKHLLHMLTSSQSLTWFQVPGHKAHAVSATGVGPGDPLADILYNVAMIPVLNRVDTLLAQAGLCTVWPDNTSTPFWDLCRSNRSGTCFDSRDHSATSAYVDDYSALAPLDISSQDNLLEKITVMPKIVSNVLHSRGMNLNAPKSGIMLTLVGKHSAGAKQILANT